MFDGLGYPRLVFAGHFQPGHVRDILRSVAVAYRNGGITFFARWWSLILSVLRKVSQHVFYRCPPNNYI